MKEVEFTEMRTEVINAIGALADRGYQQRVWVGHEYPSQDYYDDLTLNINILYNDTRVLPDPGDAVGSILFPTEVKELRFLAEALTPLIDELGDSDDVTYLSDPRWDEVVSRAGDALQFMKLAQSDQTDSE